jgi:hypothetical protein
MKPLVLILLTVAAVSGCAVYPYGYGRGDGASRYHHGGYERNDANEAPRTRGTYRDSDSDGVPNRQDAQPANPRRW